MSSSSPLAGNSVFPPLYCVCSFVRWLILCVWSLFWSIYQFVHHAVQDHLDAKSWSQIVSVLWLLLLQYGVGRSGSFASMWTWVILLIPTDLTSLRCLYILNRFSSLCWRSETAFSFVHLLSWPRSHDWAVKGNGRHPSPQSSWCLCCTVLSVLDSACLCPAAAGLWKLRGQWHRSRRE